MKILKLSILSVSLLLATATIADSGKQSKKAMSPGADVGIGAGALAGLTGLSVGGYFLHKHFRNGAKQDLGDETLEDFNSKYPGLKEPRIEFNAARANKARVDEEYGDQTSMSSGASSNDRQNATSEINDANGAFRKAKAKFAETAALNGVKDKSGKNFSADDLDNADELEISPNRLQKLEKYGLDSETLLTAKSDKLISSSDMETLRPRALLGKIKAGIRDSQKDETGKSTADNTDSLLKKKAISEDGRSMTKEQQITKQMEAAEQEADSEEDAAAADAGQSWWTKLTTTAVDGE